MDTRKVASSQGEGTGTPRTHAASGSDTLRIFLNYRRDDGGGRAYRLWDALTHPRGGEAGFAEEQIFMDIDTLEPGVDFVEAIQEAVASCDVFLAVIGRQWLRAADADGNRRLDNPEDFVRLEIETALERGVRVIPIRVDGAEMPRSDQLPQSLATLTRRHAVPLTDESWLYETGKLFKALKKLERDKGAPGALPAAPEPAPPAEPAASEEEPEPPAVEAAPARRPKAPPALVPKAARYDVVLLSAGTSKAKAKALVRDLTGLSAKRSGELVTSLPGAVRQALPRGEADFIARQFAATGAETELRPTTQPAKAWRPSLFRLAAQLLRVEGAYPLQLVGLGPQAAVRVEDVLEPEERLKRHLLVLGAHLEEGETLVNLALGNLDWQTGLLCVTDRRLLFITYASEGETANIASFRYETVTGVTDALTVTSGKLNIFEVVAGAARLKAISHIVPATKKSEILEYTGAKVAGDE